MPLQITAFKGYALTDDNGRTIQCADGAPVAVSASDFTGSYTVPAGAKLIRIKGDGTIAWDGVATAEAFSGVEYRGVRAGQTFTVA